MRSPSIPRLAQLGALAAALSAAACSGSGGGNGSTSGNTGPSTSSSSSGSSAGSTSTFSSSGVQPSSGGGASSASAAGSSSNAASSSASGAIQLNGAVQKGPYVIGSTINVSPLNASLEPSGQLFSTQTLNNRGEFALSLVPAGAVSVEGLGYYFNEVVNSLSGPLTLRAFYVPTAAGTQQVYVNMVTHVSGQRIRALVASGTAFDAAVTQAESELREQLAITEPTFSPGARGVEMNVAGGAGAANAYLLGVSAVLVQVARARPGTSLDGNVQEVLNTVSTDLADGTLEVARKTEIRAALAALRATEVENNLRDRLAFLGVTADVPDLDTVLDQDSDGRANATDNCPFVANPGWLDSDNDGAGDACDLCPMRNCGSQVCLPASPADGRPDAQCLDSCTGDADCGGGVCLSARLGASAPVSFCGTACDPLAATACTGGLACLFFARVGVAQSSTPSDFAWACGLDDLHGQQPQGAACRSLSDCAGVSLCNNAGVSPLRAGRCAPACPTAGGGSCMTSCAATAGLGAGVGLCAPPPGEPGAVCSTGTAGSCAAGLSCVEGSTQCSGGPAAAGAACCEVTGSFGQACASGTLACDAGLGCVQNASPGPDAACGTRASCCLPAGAAGQACPINGCNMGLGCGNDPNGSTCEDDLSRCCQPGGGEGQSCENVACSAGLVCLPEVQTCARAGGLNQPCLENPAGNRCNADLGCVADAACPAMGGGEGPFTCCRPAGGLNEACFPDNTCDAGLACVGTSPFPRPDDPLRCVPAGGDGQPCLPMAACNAGFACFTDSSQTVTRQLCRAAGAQGQRCLPDETCNAGLTCIITADNMMTGGACLVAGGDGQPCLPGSQCNAGFGCFSASGTPTGPTTCRPAGTDGLRCYPDRTCEPGLTCQVDTSGGSGNVVTTCLPAGGENLLCYADNTCDAGLSCVTAPACPGYPFDACCRAAGGLNQDCRNGSCDTGLTCESDTCRLTGARGAEQACGPAGQCQLGLACSATGCLYGLDNCCKPTGDGGAFEPCGANRACDAGLACGGDCGNGLAECCKPLGVLGAPCLPAGTSPRCSQGLACVRASSSPTDLRCLGGACGAGSTCSGALTCVNGFEAGGMFCALGVGACCLPVGAEGGLCRSTMSGGPPCDAPDNVCGQVQGAAGARCVPAGGEGEPCLSGNACDAGLACATPLSSGQCNGNGPCCVPSGALNEPCNADGTCDAAGLGCQTSGGAYPATCVAGRAAGQSCGAQTPCVGSLFCGTSAAECGATGACCLPRFAPGEACGGNSARCSAGNVCAATAQASCSGSQADCCVASGGRGEPCNLGGTCDNPTADACLGGVCTAAGAAGQACLPGARCSAANLSCASGACLEFVPGMCGQCPAGAACLGGGQEDVCYRVGGLNQPCTPQGTCAGALACVQDSSCPPGLQIDGCCQ